MSTLEKLFNSCSFDHLRKLCHSEPFRKLVQGQKRLTACVAVGATIIVIRFTVFVLSGDRMPNFRQFEAGVC